MGEDRLTGLVNMPLDLGAIINIFAGQHCTVTDVREVVDRDRLTIVPKPQPSPVSCIIIRSLH